MAKNKSKFKFHVLFDSPVTTCFALLTVVLFLIDSLILKGRLSQNVFAAPTTANGNVPFVINNPFSYLKLFLYVFGFTDKSVLVSNMIIILLLGPDLEEKYGSVVIGIMMLLSVLVSGVLSCCFCTNGISGANSIVFMMILLNSYLSIYKKKIPLSSVVVLALFIFGELFSKNTNGIISMLVNIAGGLCGSLLAFLTSPKARAVKKAEKKSLVESDSNFANDEKFNGYDFENLDEKPADKEKKSLFGGKKKKSKKSDSDDETTVIGTIEL